MVKAVASCQSFTERMNGCDFQLGASKFQVGGCRGRGGERRGRGAQISASSVPLYIYAYDSE